MMTSLRGIITCLNKNNNNNNNIRFFSNELLRYLHSPFLISTFSTSSIAYSHHSHNHQQYYRHLSTACFRIVRPSSMGGESRGETSSLSNPNWWQWRCTILARHMRSAPVRALGRSCSNRNSNRNSNDSSKSYNNGNSSNRDDSKLGAGGDAGNRMALNKYINDYSAKGDDFGVVNSRIGMWTSLKRWRSLGIEEKNITLEALKQCMGSITNDEYLFLAKELSVNPIDMLKETSELTNTSYRVSIKNEVFAAHLRFLPSFADQPIVVENLVSIMLRGDDALTEEFVLSLIALLFRVGVETGGDPSSSYSFLLLHEAIVAAFKTRLEKRTAAADNNGMTMEVIKRYFDFTLFKNSYMQLHTTGITGLFLVRLPKHSPNLTSLIDIHVASCIRCVDDISNSALRSINPESNRAFDYKRRYTAPYIFCHILELCNITKEVLGHHVELISSTFTSPLALFKELSVDCKLIPDIRSGTTQLDDPDLHFRAFNDNKENNALLNTVHILNHFSVFGIKLEDPSLSSIEKDILGRLFMSSFSNLELLEGRTRASVSNFSNRRKLNSRDVSIDRNNEIEEGDSLFVYHSHCQMYLANLDIVLRSHQKMGFSLHLPLVRRRVALALAGAFNLINDPPSSPYLSKVKSLPNNVAISELYSTIIDDLYKRFPIEHVSDKKKQSRSHNQPLPLISFQSYFKEAAVDLNRKQYDKFQAYILNYGKVKT